MYRSAGGCITGDVAPVTVLLAISDPLREALLLRGLNRGDGVVIVGTEQHGRRALQAILRIGPDVAVLDTGLPTLDGLQLCRQLMSARPEVATRVLLLDGAPPVTREVAVGAGAAGCLPATATIAQLQDAIASIANGGTMFHT
jgi:two-component system, LuxR family, secretion system response regulator SsrB